MNNNFSSSASSNTLELIVANFFVISLVIKFAETSLSFELPAPSATAKK